MELLTFNPDDKKPSGTEAAVIVWRVRVVAWLKAFMGFLFGILVGVIGVIAHPFFMAAECYKNHAWPWELLK